MGSINGDDMSLQLENSGDSGGGQEERILVSVRVRPINAKEVQRNDTVVWECINNTTIIFKNNPSERNLYPTAYAYDRVFGGQCSTRQVYEEAAKEVALSVVKGINSSIFAYGQTSSGKTYTMSGITEYFVEDVYDYITKHEEREFVLKFSAIEIYNESVRDLLSDDSTPLRLLDDPEKGTIVEKLTEETLTDKSHLQELIAWCEAQRQVGETSLNETSSRSHQILRLTIDSSARQFVNRERSSSLAASVNFVDLAGSERASQLLSAGSRLKEGSHINRSLLTLGTVIRKLSKGRNSHIPFRDSKLTRILQPYLGGNAKTAIICTMSPAQSHVEQSRNTLLFATCAKEVTTSAKVNIVMSDKILVKHLQRELARLENELKYPKSASSSSDVLKEKDAQIRKLEQELKELMHQKDLAQSQLDDLLRVVGDDRSSRQWDESSETSEISILSGTKFQNPNYESRIETPPDHLELLNISDKGHTRPPISNPAFMGAVSHKKRRGRSIKSISSECSSEHYNEVECIEIHAISPSRTEEFDLMSIDETSSLLPLTQEDKLEDPLAQPSLSSRHYEAANETSTVDDWAKPDPDESILMSVEQKVGSPKAVELPKESVTRIDDKFLCTGQEASSKWSSVEKPINSKELVITRSRSCKPNLMARSVPTWFDNAEQHNEPISTGLLKELSKNSKVFSKRQSEIPSEVESALPFEKLDVGDAVKSQIIHSVPEGGNEEMAQCKCENQGKDYQETKMNDIKDIADEKSSKDVEGEIVSSMNSPLNWSLEFAKKQKEIIELWQACNISLVHRSCFFLLSNGGDPADSFYIEVEHKRLSFLRNCYAGGNSRKIIVADGTKVSLASSLKNLRRERNMIYKKLRKNLSPKERESLYSRWGIPLSSKKRTLKLCSLLWTKTDMDHVKESASIVAKLVGVANEGQGLKEMFGLSFSPAWSKK